MARVPGPGSHFVSELKDPLRLPKRFSHLWTFPIVVVTTKEFTGAVDQYRYIYIHI